MKKEVGMIEERKSHEKEKTKKDVFKEENLMLDNCVTCDKETSYDLKNHMDERIGYVKGIGQLCLDCYDEVYVKKTKPAISFVKIGKRGKRRI